MTKNNYKPAHIIPFQLYNIKDFVVTEHETFHPHYEQVQYQEYWTTQAERCLAGHWGHDFNSTEGLGGYRWMPGNLYFYVNMSIIKVEGDEGREAVEPPSLRDIEWYIFYALAECDGFSGFELDDEYTCYLPIGKLQGKVRGPKGEKVTELLNKEKIRLERYADVLKKPNGEYKTYITPKEALYRIYDKPMGKPMYHNEAKNLIILSSRGIGKSFSISNGVVQYDFTFGSARTTAEFFAMKNPSVSVVGSVDSSKSASLLSKFAASYEYTRKTIGAFPEEGVNSPFYQPYGGSLTTGKSITNSVKETGGKSTTGTGSEVHHVSYKDNISAGVGERARRMVVEEAGLLSNFEGVHAENSGTQKRDTKIGYTVYIGTGGNIEKIKGIREAFYDPASYECVSFKDVFSNKPSQIGLFVPAYYRSSDYKDENGNTDVLKAFADEMQERNTKEASGSSAYQGHVISYPIVPSEMFLQSKGNLFPTKLAETRLTELETGLWKKLAKPGVLNYVNKENTKVIWHSKPLSECSVVARWGDEKSMDDDELAGTIIVYEHPTEIKPPISHVGYKYLVTYDPIRDEDGGTSLASVVVWKFFDLDNPEEIQFNIVAEWTGRHIGTGGLEKDHEIAFKLASYYTCPIFPEINLKDILRHGRMTDRWFYFLPKPNLAIDAMNFKQKKDYKVGLYISPPMKPDLEKYLNAALHTVVDRKHSIIGDVEDYSEVKMMSQVPSMRFCEEILYYSRDGNFDMISSAMLFGVVNRQRLDEPAIMEQDNEVKAKDQSYLEYMGMGNNSNNKQRVNPAFSY